jgi:hypothetical protein
MPRRQHRGSLLVDTTTHDTEADVPTNDPHLSEDDRRGWRPRRRGPGLALSALLAVALLGAACGDDDNDAATDSAEQPSDDAGAAGAASDDGAYCDATLAIETVGEPDIDFETATPEEMAAATTAFVTDTMQPLVDDVVASAPDELSDEIEVMTGALDEVGRTGDFAAFETPEVSAASDAAHAYDLENCDWATVDVVAADYSFAGIPAEVDAGTTSFELTNEGAEVHEIALVKKNEGVTESFDELLALPQDQAEQKVTFIAVGGPVPGGESTYAVADLEEGEYIAICFIPMGMTAMDGPPPEGPPHFMSGMTSEFTVA